MLKEIFEAIALGWYFGLGILAVCLFLKLVELALDYIDKVKNGKLCCYHVYFKYHDDGIVLYAHDEFELMDKLAEFIDLYDSEYLIYEVPYSGCCDVSKWKLVSDSTFSNYMDLIRAEGEKGTLSNEELQKAFRICFHFSSLGKTLRVVDSMIDEDEVSDDEEK